MSNRQMRKARKAAIRNTADAETRAELRAPRVQARINRQVEADVERERRKVAREQREAALKAMLEDEVQS